MKPPAFECVSMNDEVMISTAFRSIDGSVKRQHCNVFASRFKLTGTRMSR